MTARLHALEVGPLSDLKPEWRPAVTEQRRIAVTKQRDKGLAPLWLRLAGVEDYLASVPLPPALPVLLHTELMHAHVFVDPQTLEIQGLIDFEPSMVGHPEYELGSVGLFITRGQSSLFSSYLAGYGLDWDRDLARRCLAYTLLHRYSNLKWYLGFMPAEASFEALVESWWGR